MGGSVTSAFHELGKTRNHASLHHSIHKHFRHNIMHPQPGRRVAVRGPTGTVRQCVYFVIAMKSVADGCDSGLSLGAKLMPALACDHAGKASKEGNPCKCKEDKDVSPPLLSLSHYIHSVRASFAAVAPPQFSRFSISSRFSCFVWRRVLAVSKFVLIDSLGVCPLRCRRFRVFSSCACWRQSGT